MTPEELLNTLINQSKHKIAGRDLKIIDNPDGTKGILFGNEGMQKSFTLYPKEKNFRKQDLAAKDYTEEIYNDNNPSASSFITKDEDWEDLRGSLQSYLKSGYDIVQNKDYLPNDLARIRKEKGIDSIVKELSGGSVILKKLNDNSNGRIYSKMIFQIINDKPNGLTINSFDIASTKNATSSIVVVIQGKAPTRELLVNFKDKLESDPLVTKVELPVSDLAKNKDISYSMKVSLIGIYENKF